MGRFSRILHRQEKEEVPCPRCSVPAPPDAAECALCGWDLHEKYEGPPLETLAAAEAERPQAAL